MDNYSRGRLGILACKSGRPFAEKVSSELDKIIEKEGGNNHVGIRATEEEWFANGEVKTKMLESIRNQDIYIFQDVENKTPVLDTKDEPIEMKVNNNVMALFTAVDAAKRADAHYITVVIPTFPYARQDKPSASEGVTSSLIANFLEGTGVTRVITLDIHNEAIGGFFDKATLENLHASRNLCDYITENIDLTNLIVVSPDTGAVTRNKYYANKLQKELNMIYKKRDYTTGNMVKEMILLGDVKGKDVLLVDDLIDTGGTLKENVILLKNNGAGNIYFACSLPLFNHKAPQIIDELYENKMIKKVIGTDAVYKSDDFKREHEWYAEVSVAKYFARVMYNINQGISISRLLK